MDEDVKCDKPAKCLHCVGKFYAFCSGPLVSSSPNADFDCFKLLIAKHLSIQCALESVVSKSLASFLRRPLIANEPLAKTTGKTIESIRI